MYGNLQIERRKIIKAFEKDFSYLTPQFKHRIEKRRKFTLEYDEDEEEHYLEGPVKSKNKIRRKPIIFVEQIFEKIHHINFDRAQTGRVKTNYQVNLENKLV